MRYLIFSISLFLAAGLLSFMSACRTGSDAPPGPVGTQAEWEKRVRENYSDWKPGVNVPEPAVSAKTSKAAAPVAASPALYKVAKGDTLFSISKKFYKDSARWKLIYDANRNLLPAPSSIKPGMELRIPPLK